MEHQRESATIEMIYGAALSPRSRGDAMAAICDLLGTPVGATVISDNIDVPVDVGSPNQPSVTLHSFSGASPTAFVPYRDYYYARDPRWNCARKQGVGSVYVDFPEIAADVFHKTEIFCDYFRSYGLDRPMGVTLQQNNNIFATFTTYLPVGQDFNGLQIDTLRRLAPHMVRALQIEHRLALAERRGADLISTLGHLHNAIFLVDNQCIVREMNDAAHAILRTHSDLLHMAKNDQLTLHSVSAQDILRRSLHFAACAEDGVGPPPALHIGGKPARLSVKVAPLRHCHVTLWQPKRLIAVFIDRLDSCRRWDIPMLCEEFGFTPAEARVAAQLAMGNSVSHISDSTGLAKGTVYLHVKHLLAKAGAESQAQLVSLLFRSASALAASHTG